MRFNAIEDRQYTAKSHPARPTYITETVGRRLRGAALALLLALSPPLLADSSPQAYIDVPNAEDLAIIDGGRWVIASSMPGGTLTTGALYAIDTESRAAHSVYPQRNNDDEAGTALCPTQVAPAAFSPHGIAAQTLSSGVETLFVVNHGERESIEIFEWTSNASLSLKWVGCIPLPERTLANAVAVTPDYRVYVSVMDVPETPESEMSMTGQVLEWSEAEGWQAVPDSVVVGPNGLLVSDDGADIYLADWALGEMIKLSRPDDDEQARHRQTLSLPFLPDNLRWGAEGDILVTGLRSTPQDVTQCFLADGACGVSVPTGILSVRADEFDIRCSRDLSLEMGTATISVGDELWVGPVRGDKIWVIGGGLDDWDRCE